MNKITLEEQIMKMADQPEYAMGTKGRTWLNIQAKLAGVDYDEEPKDEFNRFNNEE